MPYWRTKHCTETFLLLGSPGPEALPDTPRRHKSAAEPHRCQFPAREPESHGGKLQVREPGSSGSCPGSRDPVDIGQSERTTPRAAAELQLQALQELPPSLRKHHLQLAKGEDTDPVAQNTPGKEKERSPLAANAAPWPDSPRSHPASCRHEPGSWTAPTGPLCHPPASSRSTTWPRRNQSPALLGEMLLQHPCSGAGL